MEGAYPGLLDGVLFDKRVFRQRLITETALDPGHGRNPYEAQQSRSHDDRGEDDTRVEMKFPVAPERAERSAEEDAIMDHEVRASKEHEENDHPLDVRAVKGAYGRLSGGEPARGHGPERMAKGVKDRHSADHLLPRP